MSQIKNDPEETPRSVKFNEIKRAMYESDRGWNFNQLIEFLDNEIKKCKIGKSEADEKRAEKIKDILKERGFK